MLALSVCFLICSAVSADDAADTKARLNELRNEKARLTYDYDGECHNIKKATEEKIAEIKKDYNQKISSCQKESASRIKEALAAYEEKLRPMLKEEEDLFKKLGASARSNFAKSNYERSVSK